MSEPPEYEPREVEQWRRRNARFFTYMRGFVVGLVAVALFWFVYRAMR